jgi:hypothetical protein
VKLAPALVVAVALALGAVACGSGSSADTKGSTTVARKNAGLGVNLQVVNDTPNPLTITICGDGTCKPQMDLQPAQSVSVSAGEVTGLIGFQSSDKVDFAARNPFLGVPYIELRSSPDRVETFDLSEGETQQVTIDGHTFTASRDPDSDFKMLTLSAR